MDIKDILLSELEHEVALTEKFLKRIPEDKLSWRPHEKSMTLGRLGSHLAEIPAWISGTMDVDDMEMSEYKAPVNESVDEMVAALRQNTEAAMQSMNKDNSAYFQKNWAMKMNGKILFEMPKYQTLRSMVLNQLPHHRAQLGVYLRMLGESVPATYGPSADEQ